ADLGAFKEAYDVMAIGCAIFEGREFTDQQLHQPDDAACCLLNCMRELAVVTLKQDASHFARIGDALFKERDRLLPAKNVPHGLGADRTKESRIPQGDILFNSTFQRCRFCPVAIQLLALVVNRPARLALIAPETEIQRIK